MGTQGEKTKQKRLGGLQGKARHNHTRNRAWRLQSQQLIEDFIDPDKHKSQLPRHIPIKHRAEFAPSAPVMGSKYGVGTEQELELVYSTDEEKCDIDGGLFDQAYALVQPEQADESAITFSKNTKIKNREQDDASVKTAERSALFDNQQSAKVKDSFTARGFVFGCAVGTATAATLLMMIRVAFL